MPIFEDNDKINNEEFLKQQSALNDKIRRLREQRLQEIADLMESFSLNQDNSEDDL